MEIMPVSATIRDCIKDPERMDEIFELVEEGKDHYGSQSFDQHLMDLVRDDVVDFKLAKAAANNPADFDLKMNLISDPRAGSGGSLAEDPGQFYQGE
jgi:twitching motility protein PilT